MAERVVDPLQPVDVHQQQAERALVALLGIEQVGELTLERAKVSEARERIGVRLRLVLARARHHVRLHRRGLDRGDRLHELLDGLGETHRVFLEVLAQRSQEHRLESGDVASDVRRTGLLAAAAQVGEGRGALLLVAREVVRIGIPLADRADDPGDQLGQLARDPLRGKLTDLVKRCALDQAHEPLFRGRNP